MFPAVTEVVLIDQSVFGAEQEIAEASAAFAHRWHSKLVIRSAVVCAGVDELVEVTVRPPHGALKNAMEVEQGDVRGHLDAAPDRRPDVAKRDFESVDHLLHTVVDTNVW